MESLRILTFVKYLPDDVRAGGGEITVWNTLKGLAGRGQTIYALICNPGKPLRKIPNVQYYLTSAYKNMRPIDFRTSLIWLANSIKTKPDVIHSFYAESFATNLVGRVRGIPVVQEVHYADLYPYTLWEVLKYPKKMSGLLWAVHLRFAKIAVMSANVVVTPSNFMRKKLVETFKLPDGKVVVIPIGVNDDFLNIENTGRKDDGTIKLLFVGRLVKEKGLDILLHAFGKLLKNHGNAHLTVIGEGPLKKEYVTLSKKLGIKSRVSFMGWIPREKILEHFKKSDILVVPSLKENFPRIVLEGMGAGLPVAASSVGGVPEEVTDGVNGILFPPADSEKLASLLVELAADENKMRSLSAQGRKTVKEKFSMRRNIMLFEDVYSKLKTIP